MAAAKLKIKITSKPAALGEIDRAKLKLENDLGLLKGKQKELTEQLDHEDSLMTRIRSTKEEVICCV